MSDKFTHRNEQADGKTLVALTGIIDEDAILERVFAGLEGTVDIDVSGITRINSCGIRSWVNVVSELASRSTVRFLNCPPVLVRQFNMISNFGGKGTVASFMLPYFCAKCDAEHDIVAQTEEFCARHPELTAPEKVCPTCGEELEFDDIEEKYFHFLRQK